jgi:hypothetical protein
VFNSPAQGQAAVPSFPVYSLAGNGWEQGQIALDNLPLFSFSFLFLILNSLPLGSVKVKHNTKNCRHLQTSGSTWTHHNKYRHRTCNCHPPTQISLHLSVSVTLPVIVQHREPQKESCCKHLGRLGPAKHKWTQNLCLLPTCPVL